MQPRRAARVGSTFQAANCHVPHAACRMPLAKVATCMLAFFTIQLLSRGSDKERERERRAGERDRDCHLVFINFVSWILMHSALCDQLYRTHSHTHTGWQTACKINHIYYKALLFCTREGGGGGQGQLRLSPEQFVAGLKFVSPILMRCNVRFRAINAACRRARYAPHIYIMCVYILCICLHAGGRGPCSRKRLP